MHGTCIVTAAEQWLNAAPFFRRKTRNRYKKTTLSRGCSAAAPQRSLIARSSLPKIMSSTSRPIYKSFIIFPSPPFFQAVSIVYPRSAPLYSGKLAELFRPRRRLSLSLCPNYMNKLCTKCKIFADGDIPMRNLAKKALAYFSIIMIKYCQEAMV